MEQKPMICFFAGSVHPERPAGPYGDERTLGRAPHFAPLIRLARKYRQKGGVLWA